MKQSAGTLLYRTVHGKLQILLVHASGNFNKKAKWGIPKGLPDQGESLEEAARRETLEETGIVAGRLTELGFVDYRKSKKRVHCFCGPAPKNAVPHCASWEIDKAQFASIEDARELMHPDQAQFIDLFLKFLAEQSD